MVFPLQFPDKFMFLPSLSPLHHTIPMPRGIILSLLAVILLLMPGTAMAITLTNLDTAHHQVAVTGVGGETNVIEMEPGSTWQTFSPHVTLQLLTGKTCTAIRAQDQDDYAIWKGGEMGVQKRRKPEGRR